MERRVVQNEFGELSTFDVYQFWSFIVMKFPDNKTTEGEIQSSFKLS